MLEIGGFGVGSLLLGLLATLAAGVGGVGAWLAPFLATPAST